MPNFLVDSPARDSWEAFNLLQEYPSFFQSWALGESEKMQSQTVHRISQISSQGKVCGIAQVYNVSARRGSFLHIRGGPVLTNFHELPSLTDFIKHHLIDSSLAFIRISPPVIFQSQVHNFLCQLGFRKSPIPLLDGEVSWILDISQNLQSILSGMRKTTRYLVNKALASSLKINISSQNSDCTNFLKLYRLMTAEKNITPHKGIQFEFTELAKHNNIAIINCHQGQELLGAALIAFYGKEAIYHHSAHQRRNNLPISYLIQWHAIKEAQRRGCKTYNFWGIEPTGNPAHPWAGLTHFKKGFGGKMRQFIGTYDLPLKFSYYRTWLIETTRRITRYKSF